MGLVARLMRTLTSPRSSSNSAMSFSIKNSMSSFSSFWFISRDRAEPYTARNSLGVGVSTAYEAVVTTTMSSMRTPP